MSAHEYFYQNTKQQIIISMLLDVHRTYQMI